jgi:hypothetical protein
MNTWQAVQQVRYLLGKRAWPDSATLVFGSASVIVTAAIPEPVFERVRLPCALIRIMPATNDPDEPGIDLQEITIRLAVGHAGDGTGETAVIGGHRVGQTDSRGRGLLEIEEEMRAAIGLLTSDHGVESQFKVASPQQAAMVGEQYIVYRDYLFRLHTTATRSYPPVTALEGS